MIVRGFSFPFPSSSSTKSTLLTERRRVTRVSSIASVSLSQSVMTSCFLSPNPNSRGERTAVIRMIPGSGWCKTSLFKQLDRYNLWWGICFFFPLHGQLIRPPFNFSASYVCYSDLSETFRVINPSPVACGQRTLPEEKTLLVTLPFGWRVGAEGSRSVIVWIKRGGSNVTCKGAVVRRSLCWDLIWLPGFNADESSRSSEVRRRAGGEWHELPRFWGENKYLAFLRGVGHIAQEFDCLSEYAFGDIYPLRRKEKTHWILVALDMGFGELDAFISHAPLNLVWIQWSTTWENMTSEKIRFLWPSVLQAGLAFLLLGKLFCLNIE